MLKLVFWIFVLVLALSFFGISIATIVNSQAGQQNLDYLTHLSVSLSEWLTLHAQSIIQRIGF